MMLAETTAPSREERLRRLRALVEAHPEDRLHMRAWSERAECGTAYCAAGLAAIDPWFQAHTRILDAFAVTDDGAGGFAIETRVVADGALTTSALLARVFAIDVADARSLFASAIHPGCAPHAVTKAEVLANINRLLAGASAQPYAAVAYGVVSPRAGRS